MIDQLDPDASFYFYLTASGGIALVSGYAAGLRLNVGALLIISMVFGLAGFFMSLGLGFSALSSIGFAALAVVALQLGYFTAMLTRRAAPRTASSDDRAVHAETQGTIGSGKGGPG